MTNSLLFRWGVVIILILWPTSNFIDWMFKKAGIKKTRKIDKVEKNKCAQYIGFLERIILLICIAGNHYEALGFIIAAKTLTRFKEIESDKTFGKKYLLGTLLSVASVMVIYYLIIGIWY